MPIPLAAIVGGASVLSGIIGASAQSAANNKNIQFQWDMWNANNEYNLPKNQRLRMEEAGFNPALMYGNGSVGNTSSAMNMPDVKPVNPVQSLPESLNTYMNIKLQELQASNLEKDIEVKDSAIYSNVSNALNRDSQTETNKFRLEQLDRNKDLVNQQMIENLSFSQLKNLNLFNENTLFPLKKESQILDNLKTTKEINQITSSTKAIDLDNISRQIKNSELTAQTKITTFTMMRQYKNLIQDGKLKQAETLLKLFEAKLNSMNLTKSDNIILRQLISTVKQSQ